MQESTGRSEVMNDLDTTTGDPLTDRLTPEERLYAMLIVTFGRDSSLLDHPLTQRVALLESGLPANSHVPDKPRVKAFISMLQERMENASERIRRLQEVGVELAVMNDLQKLLDPDTDERLRFRYSESLKDRDPQGRTLKQSVQRIVNEYGTDENSPGIISFLDECNKQHRIEGKATERRIEFTIEPGEGPTC